MRRVIGLDIGSSKLAGLVLDTDSGQIIASGTRLNSARRDGHIGACARAEIDVLALNALARELLRDLADALPDTRGLAAIGITGQQHGLAWLDAGGAPVGEAITWQDQRALLPGASGDCYLAEMISAAGGPGRFYNMGCQPAPGYAGVTLYWLAQRRALPQDAQAAFVPDAVVAHLIAGRPPTDPTLAGSSALYDVSQGRWDRELAERLGLSQVALPRVDSTGSLAGTLSAQVAASCGLSAGLPVAVALGDNQASFMGSVPDPWQSVLINMGTGGQVSALAGAFSRRPTLDTRAFGVASYLLVGAGSSGGRTLGYLHDLVCEIGRELFDIDSDDLYAQLLRAASRAPVGSAGVHCLPHLTGTRSDPAATASWSGLTVENLHLGNLTRALIEGVASDAFGFWQHIQPLAGARQRLIGAGNGLRRNPVLIESLERLFGLRMELSRYQEAAALGAALCAGVSVGLYGDLFEAMSLVNQAAGE